jgi:uncharacterized membrane protein
MTQPDALAPSPIDTPTLRSSPTAGAAAVLPVRAWHWAVLAAIVMIAVGARVHGLTLNSLWTDELLSLEASSGQSFAAERIPRGRIVDDPPHTTRIGASAPPVWRIWTSLSGDQHPPLYFITLRVWREMFGSSDWAVRSLSVVASVAGVLALFDLGRHLFDPVSALWASLIMALAHQQIWYAQEARGYAMMVAAVVAAAAVMVRAERRGYTARRGAALACCLVVAMLTHYYAFAACAAVGMYAALRLRGRAIRRAAVVVAVAAVVYAVAWGPFVIRQAHALVSDNPLFHDGAPGFAGRWLGRLLVAPARLVSPPSTGATTVSWGMWLLLVLPLLSIRRRPALLLPVLLGSACIALPAVLDLARRTLQLDHERYYLAAGPAIYLLAAALLADRRGVLRHALPAALAAYCVLSLPWVYVTHRADWRAFGGYVSRSVRADDLVVFYNPRPDWYSSVAYMAMDHYARSVAPHVLFLDAPASPDVLGRARNWRGAVWFFDVADPADARAVLPGMTPADARYAVFAGHFCRLHGAGAAP